MKFTNQADLTPEAIPSADAGVVAGDKIGPVADMPPAPVGIMLSNRRGPQVLQSRQPRQLCFDFLRGR